MRQMKGQGEVVIPMDTNGKPMAKPRRMKPPLKDDLTTVASVIPTSGPNLYVVPNNAADCSSSAASSNLEKRPVPKPRPKPRVDLVADESSDTFPACFVEERKTLSSEDRKRMTVNLFERKLVDPFDGDFEESLRDASLTTVSIPDDGSSSEEIDSDYAEVNENPVAKVTKLPVQKVTSCPGEQAVVESYETERIGVGRESVYEEISSFSSSESGISEAGRPRPLSSISNSFGGSKNSVRSEGDKPPAIPPLHTKPLVNGTVKPVFRITAPPSASPEAYLVSSSMDEKPSSLRIDSMGGASGLDVKVLHPYDEVAIEDGVVTIDDSSISRSRESCQSNPNRKSLLQEFDPLLAPISSGTYEDIDDGEFDSLVHVSPPVEGSQSDLPLGNLSVQNPEYLPLSTGVPSQDAVPSFATFEEVSDLSAFQPEEVYEPVGVKDSSTVSLSEEEASKSKRHSSGSVFSENTPRTSSPDAAETSSPNSKNSFLSRVALRTIRRIPTIREEPRPASTPPATTTTTSAESLRCSRCLLVHSDSSTSKCRFVPTARENIVYSSVLYKASSLGRRGFSERWACLSKGEINFHSRSAGFNQDKPTETVKLEKVVMVAKKEDQKVGEAVYKCFQLFLGHGRHSTMVLGDSSEKAVLRSNWMQKYIEAFTPNFPTNIISNYDRGGWCFMKENTTGTWQPTLIVLNERNLNYSFVNSELYSFVDLRKVREINLGVKDAEYQCPFVDNKDVLTLHMITKILYIQTESTKLTVNWEKAIRSAALYNGSTFEEMQLTTDDVPVMVHKCIDFLYAHGLLSEGIYRQSGANSRIANLLEEFKKDAWAVQMSPKDFSAHDVAGALKRFFRTLPEPLVTERLYSEWITAYGIKSRSGKMEQYVRLLKELPQINYNILKKLICHLHAVHELQENNLMPLDNLAPIWGPTLMSVDESVENTSKLVQSYEIVCAQCGVVRDLIENYYTLFQVDPEEIDRERRIQEGLEKFHLGAVKRKTSGDMRIYVYLHERDENSAISITLSPSMTAASIVEHICKTKFQHSKYENLALHEVIFNKSLERPIYPTERVVDIISTWSKWEMEERKHNYLILKTNTLYPLLVPFAKDPAAVFGELKYADSKSKSFRKFSFEFSGAKLKYFKDSKELESWNIEDITWYIGHEPRRTPPCKYNLTFTPKSYDFKRSKEEPFFGNVLSINEEEQRHKFIAAMIIGEHPEGLYPSVIL